MYNYVSKHMPFCKCCTVTGEDALPSKIHTKDHFWRVVGSSSLYTPRTHSTIGVGNRFLILLPRAQFLKYFKRTWSKMAGPVAILTLAFIVISYLFKKLSERLAFIFKSNLKYQFLDYIGTWIFFVYMSEVAFFMVHSPPPIFIVLSRLHSLRRWYRCRCISCIGLPQWRCSCTSQGRTKIPRIETSRNEWEGQCSRHGFIHEACGLSL